MVIAYMEMQNQKPQHLHGPHLGLEQFVGVRFAPNMFNDITTGLTPTTNRPMSLGADWKDYSNLNNVDTPTINVEISEFLESSSQPSHHQQLQQSFAHHQQNIHNLDHHLTTKDKFAMMYTGEQQQQQQQQPQPKQPPPQQQAFFERPHSAASSFLGESSKARCYPCGRTYGQATSYSQNYEEEMYMDSNSPFSSSASSYSQQGNFHQQSHSTTSKALGQSKSTGLVGANHRMRNGHTYTGEKPHQCDHLNCEKRFARIDELRRHKRTHNEFKPYACTVCEKRFTRSDHLTTHMRTHTGEKPYPCDRCNKKFARSDERLRHVKTHDRPRRCGRKPKKLLTMAQEDSPQSRDFTAAASMFPDTTASSPFNNTAHSQSYASAFHSNNNNNNNNPNNNNNYS